MGEGPGHRRRAAIEHAREYSLLLFQKASSVDVTLVRDPQGYPDLIT
jgi:hypothetical protein